MNHFITFLPPRRNFNGGQTVVAVDKQTKVNPLITLKRVRWDARDSSVLFTPSTEEQLELFNLDKIVKEEAIKNQKLWFGKEFSVDKMFSMFGPSISFDGRFKAKRMPNLQIYDILKTRVELEPNGQLMDVKIAIVGIYFKPGRFGLSYHIRQAMILPEPTLNYAFDDDSLDDFSDADSN